MAHKTISVKWIPGQDLVRRIRSKDLDGVDRVSVILWEGDTTDIVKLAKEVDRAETDLGLDIFISHTFKFKTGYK
jgi:hypothetical protein